MLRWWGVLMLALALHGRARADEPTVLKLGSIAPEGSPYHDGCLAAARLVEKNTRGAVRVKVFGNALLGGEVDMTRALAEGKLDMYAGSMMGAHEHVPELAVFDLPFLFRSEAEVDQVFEKIWPLLAETVDKRGYVLLGYTEVGFRHLGTRQPIMDVADLKGLRVRSIPSVVYEQLWRLVGARPVALEVQQVAARLESGALDGFDMSATFMYASGWQQYIKHYTLSAHSYMPGVVIIGPGGKERIPRALHRGLAEGAVREGRAMIARIRDVERQLIEQLPAMGVQVHRPADEFRRAFEQKVAGIRGEWRKTATPSGKKLLEAIEKELARLRRKS